jgi:MFS family permease
MSPRPGPALEPSPLHGISRNVFLLSLVSLATDVSTDMLYPLLPLFLTRTLGAPFAAVGLIEGLAESTASLLKGFSGWLSDRLGRRLPLVIAGYALAALTKPLLALAAGWPLVLTARVLDRFGKGLRVSPRDAMIADSSLPLLRGRAIGYHRSVDQIGAVLGPLLALPLLAAFHGDYRAIFLFAFVPAALGTALLFATRETGAAAAGAAAPPRFRLAGTSPAFRRFLLVTLVFALGNSSDAFVLLRAQYLGFSPQGVVLLFAAMNTTYVLSAYPAGILSDRLGRRRLLLAGFVLFAAVYLALALLRSAPWLWLVFPAYGLYLGLTDGIIRAFVADLVRPEHRATALGAQAMATGLAALPASALAGLLWQTLGPAAPFYYGAAMAALAAALFAALMRSRTAPA